MNSPVSKPALTDSSLLDPIRERWSGWSFSDQPIPGAVLRSIFEAACWAPSSWNDQPWRFLVGERDRSPDLHRLLVDSMLSANRAWAERAPVLVACWACGSFTHDGSVNRYAMHDLGQAVGLLQVQATALGLRVHAMGGWDPAGVRGALEIADHYVAGALLAIGFPGTPSDLADPGLRAKETSPERRRRALSQTLGFVEGGCPDWALSGE